MRRSILLLLMTALLLAGCAAPGGEPHAQPVLLWYEGQGVEEQAILRLAERFNAEHDDVRLIVEYQEEIAAKVEASPLGRRPDLVLVGTGGDRPYAEAGLALDPLSLPGTAGAAEDLTPMAALLFRQGEAWTALPLGLRTALLYTNADRLGELGVSQEPTGTLSGWLCSPQGAEEVRLALPAQAAVACGWWQSAPDRSLPLLGDLFAQGCARLYADPMEAVQHFAQGKALRLYGSSAEAGAIESALGEERFEIAVLPLPDPAGGPPRTVWEGSALLFVRGGMATPEALGKTARWFLGEEAEQLWSETTGDLPPRLGLLHRGPEGEAATPLRTSLFHLAAQLAEGPADALVNGLPLAETETRIALVQAMRALSDGQSVEEVRPLLPGP